MKLLDYVENVEEHVQSLSEPELIEKERLAYRLTKAIDRELNRRNFGA